MKTVKLVRTGPAAKVFCKDMDRGVEFEEGATAEVGESTALDLTRDQPDGWKLATDLATTVETPVPPAVIELPPVEEG